MANGAFTQPPAFQEWIQNALGAFGGQTQTAPTVEQLQQQLRGATQLGSPQIGAFTPAPTATTGTVGAQSGIPQARNLGGQIANWRTRNRIAEQAKQHDLTTPEGTANAARALYEQGEINAATAMVNRLGEMQQAQIQAIPEEKPRRTKITDIPSAGPGGEPYQTKALVDQDTGEIIRKLGRGPVRGNVNVYTGPEKEENKAKIRIAEKDYNEVAERGDSAERQLANIDQAKTLLNDETFTTGRIEPLKNEVSAWAESLGVNPATLGLDSADTYQGYTRIMNNLVLQKASQMKGNLSDKDVRFLKDSVATAADTKQSARLSLNAAKAMAEMEKRKSEFYREKFAEPRMSLTKINDAWRKSPYNVPVVGKDPRSDTPMFWDQYYNAAVQANSNNPDYIQNGNFQMDKLLNDIQKEWKKYGVR